MRGKIHVCENNPEQSSTTKVARYIACAYSVFTQCAYDDKRINFVTAEVKIVWKNSLREYAVKIINYEKKKEMTELKEEEHKSYLTDINCYKCKDKFEDMDDRTVL